MLETMRRREDDLLAISPPPEFQDLEAAPPPTSTSSVPPPQDFRDLTPSPCRSDVGLIGSISTERSQALKDFADKISFNILNEAMIIATLIPQAGVSEYNGSHHLTIPSSGKFSSDSYDSSSATSWEYLPEAVNLDLPNFPNPSGRRFQKRSLRKSTSESVALTPVSASSFEMSPAGKTAFVAFSAFSQCGNWRGAQPKRNSMFVTSSDPHEFSNQCESSRTVAIANSECYTVPFECDIYSLPVDNISNPTNAGCSSDTVSRFNSRSHREKEEAIQRLASRDFDNGGINNSDSTGAASCSRTGEVLRGMKTRHSQRERSDDNPAGSGSNDTVPGIQKSSEKNNNEEHSRARKKRKSKRIDIENLGSQSKSATSQALTKNRIESTEKEKKTLGSSFLNLFRRSRNKSSGHVDADGDVSSDTTKPNRDTLRSSRALPLPPDNSVENNGQALSTTGVEEDPFVTQIPNSNLEPRDFATRIEKVKDCGWYWGPLSSQGAEDLLRGEPDGSFIVRDSSDVHYIFSLTFKLNGLIRHVRIEHDQGNFSFGPLTRFKAATIVDFVEKAVAHSRSGRYLFFLHRRPILGPMRVQLLHPYSRYIHPRSLQHMCRFVILKHVRRDLVNSLPLPNPLLDYLNTPQYYFENKLENCEK